MRRCSRCGETKPLSEFPMNRHEKTGHGYWCKACKNAQRREYLHGNFEWRERHRERERRKREARNARMVQDPVYAAEVRRNTALAARRSMLKRNYGLTLEQYDQMAKAQDYRCAICGEPERISGKSGTTWMLTVDHCHDTGQIRGLLCNTCNSAIGHLRHDPDLVDRAAEYLRKHGH